jgi:hypothetical protein
MGCSFSVRSCVTWVFRREGGVVPQSFEGFGARRVRSPIVEGLRPAARFS